MYYKTLGTVPSRRFISKRSIKRTRDKVVHHGGRRRLNRNDAKLEPRHSNATSHHLYNGGPVYPGAEYIIEIADDPRLVFDVCWMLQLPHWMQRLILCGQIFRVCIFVDSTRTCVRVLRGIHRSQAFHHFPSENVYHSACTRARGPGRRTRYVTGFPERALYRGIPKFTNAKLETWIPLVTELGPGTMNVRYFAFCSFPSFLSSSELLRLNWVRWEL